MRDNSWERASTEITDQKWNSIAAGSCPTIKTIHGLSYRQLNRNWCLTAKLDSQELIEKLCRVTYKKIELQANR